MYLKRTITTIVAVLIIAATGNAITVTPAIPETPSSGGGGGSGPPILVGTYLDQNINFKHFGMSGHASNWNAGNASFNGKVYLEDGFYNSSFLYADMRQSYFGNPINKRIVYTVLEASFYSHEGQYGLEKPEANFETSSNIFFPGINISARSSIISNNGTSSSFPNLFPPSYNYYVNLWADDAIIQTMNIDSYWNTDENRLYTRFYLSINLTGDIGNVNAFTSSLQELPVEMQEAFAVPEPATISILGLGILSLLRRKNH